MSTNLWYMIAGLVFLLTLSWIIKHNIKDIIKAIGITAFATIGYTIIAGLVIAAILYIIKWYQKTNDA